MTYSKEKHREWEQKKLEEGLKHSHLTCSKCNLTKEISLFHTSAIRRSSNPKCKSCASILGKFNYRKDIKKNLLRLAKRRSEEKMIEFSIDESDIIIPETCPLLKIPIKIGRHGKAQSDNSPNVDRIDSKKGYIKGNVQVISARANRIKYNASLEELQILVFNLKNIMESLNLIP